MRTAITGLLSLAGAEEQLLLLEDGSTGGSPDNWAAVPLVAHLTHFKQQQTERISALLSGHVPPAYGDVDHSAPEVYSAYNVAASQAVLADSRRVTAGLIDGTWALPSELVLHGQVNGRMLWLQLIVRGFWHPMGHLGDYYCDQGQANRAVAMQSHALATARHLATPAPAEGMAVYNLACALARSGSVRDAARMLETAIALNPDLRTNASSDPDLALVQ